MILPCRLSVGAAAGVIVRNGRKVTVTINPDGSSEEYEATSRDGGACCAHCLVLGLPIVVSIHGSRAAMSLLSLLLSASHACLSV